MSGSTDRMYARAEQVFGRHSQLVAAAEECAELAAACSRFANGKCSESEVIEELADVELICGQLRRFFGDVAVDAVLGVKTHRFLARLDAIEQKGAPPCPTPTPSGASADTIATVTTHQTPDATPACSTPSDQIRGHSTSSAPPPTEEPEAVRTVRATLDIFPYAHGTAGKLLAAYDAERAKLAKIAAILSDDTLEHPQKIGRALRVAEGQS